LVTLAVSVSTNETHQDRYDEGGKVVEQIAQGGGRCPVPGNIQGQVRRGSVQSDLVVEVPAYCRGIGVGDL